MCGRAGVGFLEAGVKAADAAEAGSQSDLTHGKAAFINQLLGEMQAAGLRDGDWAGAQMLKKETAKMARADPQASGESVNSTIFKRAFAD